MDMRSEECFFDRTTYYKREMGWPLHRRFVSFTELADPEELVETKLRTNRLERDFMKEGRRLVNIDPGYVSLERLILATGKNYTHRVYLSKGIFADLTLIFQRGGFRALEWTYPDYAEDFSIAFFNSVRERYMTQLRESKSVKNLEEAIGEV